MPDISTLGYGAANVGNLYRVLGEEEAIAVLEAAWESGVRYFDTAPHYGLGLSERRLGAFLATKPRGDYTVSTKVGRLLRPAENPDGRLDERNDFAVPADHERVWDFTETGIRASLDESLERLGLDRVDMLFLHDPEKYSMRAAEESAYPALLAMRDEGLVTSVGVGSLSVDALTRAAMIPELDVLMIAGRLTLAEQPALATAIPLAVANGIDVVAAGVFNSGLLATSEPGGRYEYGSVPGDVVERARAIAAVCRDFGVDLPTAALQYTLRIAPVVSVVVGGSRPAQLAENSARMQAEVPEALWGALSNAGLIP